MRFDTPKPSVVRFLCPLPTLQPQPVCEQDQLSGCSLCTASHTQRPSEAHHNLDVLPRGSHPCSAASLVAPHSFLRRRLSRLGKAAIRSRPTFNRRAQCHKPREIDIDHTVKHIIQRWRDTTTAGVPLFGVRVNHGTLKLPTCMTAHSPQPPTILARQAV
jgi:hypothetical protein